MKDYNILTINSIKEIVNPEEREKIYNDQNKVLESLGINIYSCKEYPILFKDGDELEMTIKDAIESLDLKDGCDLVKWDDGFIGFIAYNNKHIDYFKILETDFRFR